MIPGRPDSPFMVLQEIYYPDLWKVLTCCIMLNQTRRKQVDGIRAELFARYPDAQSMSEAKLEELSILIKPLGFYNRRAKSLIRFSKEFFEMREISVENVRKLHNIGQYAVDSYKIFFAGEIVPDPADHVLKDYVKWYNSLKSNDEHSDVHDGPEDSRQTSLQTAQGGPA